jgi:hypothetical protein
LTLPPPFLALREGHAWDRARAPRAAAEWNSRLTVGT